MAAVVARCTSFPFPRSSATLHSDAIDSLQRRLSPCFRAATRASLSMSASTLADGAAAPVVASPLVAGASSSSGYRSSGAASAPREYDVVLSHPTPPPQPALQKTCSRSTTVSVELVSPTEGLPKPVLSFRPAVLTPTTDAPSATHLGVAGDSAATLATGAAGASSGPTISRRPVVPPSSLAVQEGELVSATRWLGVPSDAPLLSVDELQYPWLRRGRIGITVAEVISSAWLRPDLPRLYKVYEASGSEEAYSALCRLWPKALASVTHSHTSCRATVPSPTAWRR